MTGIISAVRGGPGSRANINKAIELARKEDLPLYFLYVVNLDFMVRTESSRIQTLSKEMREMGDFILLEAETQAEEQGVKVEGIVRQGKIGEEIIRLCQEKDADYATLGRPRGSEESDFFTQPALDKLGARIENETEAKVIYVEEEPVNER